MRELTEQVGRLAEGQETLTAAMNNLAQGQETLIAAVNNLARQQQTRHDEIAVVLAISALALAGGHGGHGGYSHQHRHQDDHGHYKFGYDIVNHYGAKNGRWEAGSAYGPVVGSYYLGDIDGRHRTVNYVADKHGFRAIVKTNEPGTKTSLPAAAPYVSAHGKHVPAYGHGGYGHGGYGHGGYGGYGHGGYGGYGHGGYGGYGGHGHGGYGGYVG
ncbi:cuticle protein 14-like [Ornithodoros turicata]|uniref:cuticle protein 14-like n=1 Tax=Ornithodoros turicata TaxID=34597 RepID=UPI003138E46E